MNPQSGWPSKRTWVVVGPSCFGRVTRFSNRPVHTGFCPSGSSPMSIPSSSRSSLRSRDVVALTSAPPCRRATPSTRRSPSSAAAAGGNPAVSDEDGGDDFDYIPSVSPSPRRSSFKVTLSRRTEHPPRSRSTRFAPVILARSAVAPVFDTWVPRVPYPVHRDFLRKIDHGCCLLELREDSRKPACARPLRKPPYPPPST